MTRHAFVSARSVVAALSVAFLAVGGCTPEPDEPSTPANPPRSGTTEPPLTVERPQWQYSGNSAGPLSDVSARDNALILRGPSGADLAVLDPSSGEKLWTGASAAEDLGKDAELSNDDGRVPIVESAPRWGIATTYRSGDDSGVALLAGTDGKVMWKRALPSSLVNDGASQLSAASETAVVGHVQPSDSGAPTGFAVRASNGSELWHQAGLVPRALSSGVVVAEKKTKDPELERTSGYVTAVDAKTGKNRWDLKKAGKWSRVGVAAGGVVVVGVGNSSNESEQDALVLDAKTGDEIANLGTVVVDQECVSDGQLIACRAQSDNGPRLVTFDTQTRRKHDAATSGPESPAARLRLAGVWEGKVFLTHATRGVSGENSVVDIDGNVVASAPPGKFLAASGGLAVFCEVKGRPPSEISAYRKSR